MKDYKERSLSLFDNAYVLPLTSPSISSIDVATMVLFYDSESTQFNALKRMYEYLARLIKQEQICVCFYAMDCRAYPDIVTKFTNETPSIYLYLYGIPIRYHGSFHLGEIHLWLKLQVTTCDSTTGSPSSMSPFNMSPSSMSPGMSPIIVPSPTMNPFLTPMPTGFYPMSPFRPISFETRYPLRISK